MSGSDDQEFRGWPTSAREWVALLVFFLAFLLLFACGIVITLFAYGAFT